MKIRAAIAATVAWAPKISVPAPAAAVPIGISPRWRKETLITRPDADVLVRVLPAGGFAFASALQSRATLGQVKLQWEAAYGKSYRIEVSDDGAAWTPVYTTATGDGGAMPRQTMVAAREPPAFAERPSQSDTAACA